jgi:hypothetical protein
MNPNFSLLIISLLALSGCQTHYKEPAANEERASIKFMSEYKVPRSDLVGVYSIEDDATCEDVFGWTTTKSALMSQKVSDKKQFYIPANKKTRFGLYLSKNSGGIVFVSRSCSAIAGFIPKSNMNYELRFSQEREDWHCDLNLYETSNSGERTRVELPEYQPCPN